MNKTLATLVASEKASSHVLAMAVKSEMEQMQVNASEWARGLQHTIDGHTTGNLTMEEAGADFMEQLKDVKDWLDRATYLANAYNQYTAHEREVNALDGFTVQIARIQLEEEIKRKARE